MHRTCDDIRGSLVAVQGVAELRLHLFRLLRVVSSPLEEVVDRNGGVLQQLVRLVSGSTFLGKGSRGAQALGEHAVGLAQQHIDRHLRTGWLRGHGHVPSDKSEVLRS